jgi:hypothetical protein
MTLPPNYARIFEALPLYLVDKAYVGGGYAVDHTKARDIDLWLLDTTVSESLLDDLMFDAPAGFTPEIIIGQSGNYDIVPGVHVSKTALYRSELFDKPIQLDVQEMAKLGLTEARQGELFREVYSVPEGVAA